MVISLGVKAAASGSDAGIHKKILGSGTTTLIISNDEMEVIMKTAKSLEDLLNLLNLFILKRSY